MPDNSNVFVAMWNALISAIGSVIGWFFDFLETFGATGLFICAVVLYIFVSYIITGSSPSSDKVSSSGERPAPRKLPSKDTGSQRQGGGGLSGH